MLRVRYSCGSPKELERLAKAGTSGKCMEALETSTVPPNRTVRSMASLGCCSKCRTNRKERTSLDCFGAWVLKGIGDRKEVYCMDRQGSV